MVISVSSDKGTFEFHLPGSDFFTHILTIAGLEAASSALTWCVNAHMGDIYSHDLFTIHVVKSFFAEE